MLNRLKKLLPNEFRQGLKRRFLHIQDMQTRLANLKRAGFQPTGAIDGGAYQGDWTKTFWNIWPTVPSLMIEPQPSQRQALSTLTSQVPKSLHLQCAIADANGRLQFSLEETNSRLGGEASNNSIEVDVRKLDDIVEGLSFNPNLLKLDLQGFELKALDGCTERLSQFEVVLLEVSILRIGDVPIFHEVDQYMTKKGYRVYDLLPTYFRPRDGALWQMDVFFVRENSALIANREWA